MSEPPVLPSSKRKCSLLLLWAITATSVALLATGFAFYSFLSRPAPVTEFPPANRPFLPFVELPETAIPGTYKWVSKSGSESFITLNADRTFSKGDATNPQHRWEITRDALVIFWLKSQNRLNRIVSPGVYAEVQDGVEITRLEKQ
jgi:hypothetical protein